MLSHRIGPSYASYRQEYQAHGWKESFASVGVHFMKRAQKGFSLIELLIVVAIILIIAAIAIPNLLRARMQANEASAAASLHALNTAEISYSSAFPAIGFSASLANLGDGGISPCPGSATASCYIDQNLASGTKSGYVFSYTQDASSTPSLHYGVNVDPLSRGISGQRSFYSSDTRYNTTGVASSADAPIQ
jgi:prepilin-type N-terminal cleavage/methylation domain-containing protein